MTDYQGSDLDFTKMLDPKVDVPEPVPTAQQQQAWDDEAIVGESKLTSNGFFVRLFPDAPRRAPMAAPPTILVIEDDEMTAAMLKAMLTRENYKVILAVDRAGIAAGMKERPDLVLLDVLLPDANGFDILNRIRVSKSLNDLPVLMLSSLGSLDDIMKGLKMGANGYLTKPAKSKALMKAIEEVIFKVG